ncbi:hypothetical protein AAV97_05135 [Acinetobacter sp. Ag2]|uniref:hypothetical protein n=1 Tax=Acinetobacter sp. Ag2 TaxID=1646532 RepID=UPI0006292A2B|nr:hypothetical protein [Acinetobacter sp. Ag2]KKW80401.1 hypothetical protein AAV97_05135 [Acinetobacter sp. Ag2]
MVDKTEISKPIEIKDNSVERVAFDLMQKIVDAEISHGKGDYLKPTPREYFLKLYNQSHKVVSRTGIDIDLLLKD